MVTQGALEASKLFSLDGLVALVTGGGSGIGLMMTQALAENGASKVYIAGRRLDVLETAAKSIGSNVIPIQCDVTSKESLAETAAIIEKEAGYLNLLVCNSGIGGPPVPLPSSETTADEWARQNLEVGYDDYMKPFSVNTASVWFTTMTFVKLLDLGNKKGNLEQSSQVIITGSIDALKKRAGSWAYSQSKAATAHAAKQLAVVLPQWNIRANVIAPGIFPSIMSDSIIGQYADDSAPEGYLPPEVVPLQRAGRPQDMGGSLVYLASRAGAYCNGASIVVDGGRIGTFPSTQ